MNPQKTNKLFKDLKSEVAQLEQRASQARYREQMAKSVAADLENRNRLAIETMGQEVEIKRSRLLTEADQSLKELKSQIPRLKSAKAGLHNEIEALLKSKADAQADIDALEEDKLTVQSEITQAEASLTDINDKLEYGVSKLAEIRAKCDDTIKHLTELSDSRAHIEEDISLMQQEASSLENQIIELDASFRDRSQVLDSQLSDKQLKLKNVTASLLESEKKDEAIRQSLAERQLSLEKREKVIRKRELLIGEGQARLQAQDDFMKI